MAAPGACQPTPISTIFETTTLTSLVPTASGSTTYVLVDPQAETIATTFSTIGGQLVPIRATVTGATVTTTEALTVTQTSLIVTSVPVSTVFNSCPGPPNPTSSATSSTVSSTSSSVPTSSSTTTSSTTSSTPTTTSTRLTPSSTTTSTPTSSAVSSSSSSASSASSTALLPSSNSDSSNSSSTSPNNLAAIIGGSVGGGVGAIILLGLLFWCCCARNRRKDHGDDTWRSPPPFLTGEVGHGHHTSSAEDLEEKPGAAYHSGERGSSGSPGRLSRKFVGAGAGAALAGGVSAYEHGSQRRKSGKSRPADEQDAYYRNTWVEPEAPRRQETPVSAGFAGVGAGRATGGGPVASSRIAPPQPQRQSTFANMMENATTFDPRARDGGWAVANEPFNGQQGSAVAGPSQLQPRSQMPPPMPLPLPGMDYRQNSQPGPENFLVPPSQSRFNRYDSPSHQPPQPGRNQTSGYDSPAPSHMSMPALGPYVATGDSERGGNQLRVTNMGTSTTAGSDWGSTQQRYEGDWNDPREELNDDQDPYGGLDAGLDHRQQRY
ncbi:uncharacterized protein JCM15063_003721 [Sporobolomyces koalae]|uniref:uncharacterized protein n=1 Tax=Sporobolomyces koalae TaxID=500713 RepID=UPI00317C4A74